MRTIICVCLFFAVISVYSQNDSLTVVWQGHFKNEKYKIYYKDSCYGVIKPEKKKVFMTFPVDSSLKDNDAVRLDIYKKSFFGLFYRNTYFGTFYDSSKKYLIIYRNFKLKKRYAVEPIWSDELLRFR